VPAASGLLGRLSGRAAHAQARKYASARSLSHTVKNDTSAQTDPAAARNRRRVNAGKYPFGVRLTEFWARMRAQFGEVYAQSVAKDYVFAKLGERTIEQALADGEDAKVVWRAVCETFNVPEKLR
jgi:hypothetical protein